MLCPLLEECKLFFCFFIFWSFSLFVNHPPTSFQKHLHNLSLLNEGCSMICCISAHLGLEVSSLSSAICYA